MFSSSCEQRDSATMPTWFVVAAVVFVLGDLERVNGGDRLQCSRRGVQRRVCGYTRACGGSSEGSNQFRTGHRAYTSYPKYLELPSSSFSGMDYDLFSLPSSSQGLSPFSIMRRRLGRRWSIRRKARQDGTGGKHGLPLKPEGPSLNNARPKAPNHNKGERSLGASSTISDSETKRGESNIPKIKGGDQSQGSRSSQTPNSHIATVYDFIGRGGDSNIDYLYPPTVDERTGSIKTPVQAYYSDSLFKDDNGKIYPEDEDDEDYELFNHRQSAHPNSKDPSSWLTQFEDKADEITKTVFHNKNGNNDNKVAEEIAWDLRETAETSEEFNQRLLEDPMGDYVSQDPKLVKAFNGTGLMYEVVRIDANDDMTITQTEQLLSRRNLLKMSGLRPRDLRRVDPSLSLSTAGPDMSVRQRMMLINIGSVKAIVTNQSAIIFKHPSFTCKRFLRLLGNRIQANFRYAMSSDWEERKLQVPFELVVGEAALISSSSPLEFDLLKAQPLLTRFVNRLKRKMTKAGVAQETLEQVRQFKQKLITVESRAQAMRSMLMEMLDDEDDLERLALSAINARDGDQLTKEEQDQRELYVEEWEMLLEYYLLRYETISSEASRMLEEARDLEETVSLTLSSRRLQLSRLELLLSICSLSVATGAMIAGIFGMNLLSGFELSKGVFWGVFFGIVAGAAGMAWAITFHMRKQGML